MKTAKILTLVLFLLGSEGSKTNEGNQSAEELNCENIESRVLSFLLKNETDVLLREIRVGLPDTMLKYERLHAHSSTNTILVKCAYSYGFIEFKDDLDSTYRFFPVDYYGEKLYTQGRMTHIIKSIDRIDNEVSFDFTSE